MIQLLISRASSAPPPETTCDVIIAGGSLASLAAAVSAANYSSDQIVCFLEPTDWPGGQLTASAVPAVDFGPNNRDNSANVAQSFASFLFGPSMPGDTNLGDCWASSIKVARTAHTISNSKYAGVTQVLSAAHCKREFRVAPALVLPQSENFFNDHHCQHPHSR
jgi:hypothetical protein